MLSSVTVGKHGVARGLGETAPRSQDEEKMSSSAADCTFRRSQKARKHLPHEQQAVEMQRASSTRSVMSEAASRRKSSLSQRRPTSRKDVAKPQLLAESRMAVDQDFFHEDNACMTGLDV